MEGKEGRGGREGVRGGWVDVEGKGKGGPLYLLLICLCYYSVWVCIRGGKPMDNIGSKRPCILLSCTILHV